MTNAWELAASENIDHRVSQVLLVAGAACSQRTRKGIESTVLLFNVSFWLSQLTPEAQNLFIQCLFLLALALLLIVAFYPAGAKRIFSLIRLLWRLPRQETRDTSCHAKKQRALPVHRNLRQGRKP
jgi:hypothetical protein